MRSTNRTRRNAPQPSEPSAMTAAKFNAAVPVGTAVTYTPMVGGKERIQTRTRSEAWTLGSGHAVVLVEGSIGGVSVDAVTLGHGEPG